jgi:murein DD-endopeptidase MepM/ murein hydrolase activator NlpD
MGKHSGFEWHDNGSLVWTWRLTLTVSGVALALLAIAGLLWAADGTGNRGLAAFTIVAPFSGVALLVAVLGRITSTIQLRYHDAELPVVPPSSRMPSAADARRRSTGRANGIAYVFMVITGGGFANAAVLNWNDQPRAISVVELVWAACGVVGCFLAGPAARFVVTPEYLRIDTGLRRFTVPRHMIVGFAHDFQTLKLRLEGDDHLDVRVDSPLWDLRGGEYRTNYRPQLRTAERIVALMREVPAAGSTHDRVIIAPRWGMRVLAIATGVVAVAATVGFFIALRSCGTQC